MPHPDAVLVSFGADVVDAWRIRVDQVNTVADLLYRDMQRTRSL